MPMLNYYKAPAKNPAVDSPTTKDISFMAGFFEGEGYCEGRPTTIIANLTQKEPEILDRAVRYFGGRVMRGLKTSYKGEKVSYCRWYVTGARARGFLLTIYSFLSERRKKQIRNALVWDLLPLKERKHQMALRLEEPIANSSGM